TPDLQAPFSSVIARAQYWCAGQFESSWQAAPVRSRWQAARRPATASAPSAGRVTSAPSRCRSEGGLEEEEGGRRRTGHAGRDVEAVGRGAPCRRRVVDLLHLFLGPLRSVAKGVLRLLGAQAKGDARGERDRGDARGDPGPPALTPVRGGAHRVPH